MATKCMANSLPNVGNDFIQSTSADAVHSAESSLDLLIIRLWRLVIHHARHIGCESGEQPDICRLIVPFDDLSRALKWNWWKIKFRRQCGQGRGDKRVYKEVEDDPDNLFWRFSTIRALILMFNLRDSSHPGLWLRGH